MSILVCSWNVIDGGSRLLGIDAFVDGWLVQSRHVELRAIVRGEWVRVL